MTLSEWAELSPSQQKRQFYLELRAYWEEQCAKGKTIRPGWVAMKYRARFGSFPPDGAERLSPASEVSDHVRDWIRGQNIAFHKDQARREAGSMGASPRRRRAGTASEATTDAAGDA